jgi:fucose permease
MKDHNFALFIILSFLATIPFSMYWSYCSEFLLNRKFEYISITMNFGQLAEMIFLLTVPFSIKKIGLRGTMILGLIAMLIRYAAFYIGSATDNSEFYFIGILVHGLIFGYFYLGGQIYIDKKAPAELKSQAQGFIFFVTFGLGLLVGNFISGQIIEHYSSSVGASHIYDWKSIWALTSQCSLALLIIFILSFKNDEIPIPRAFEEGEKEHKMTVQQD